VVSRAFPSASRAQAVQASRSRQAVASDLVHIPWLARLDEGERQRVIQDLRVVDVEPGELLCRVGRPVTFWFGVIDGLLKMSTDNAQGQTITYTGIPPGGWSNTIPACSRIQASIFSW
jgi:CRP-like cAMP-binding protein